MSIGAGEADLFDRDRDLCLSNALAGGVVEQRDDEMIPMGAARDAPVYFALGALLGMS